MIYPWTHSQWLSLVKSHQNDRLPHALILSGLEGLGKRRFATEFARYLLCEHPQNEQGCGRCRACIQFEAKTHPDFQVVEPEEAGKQIKIDQIRALSQGFGLARHSQSHRVVIIAPADAMNLAAANGLLKSLEEPPEKTLVLLITAHVSRLPATIKSRCQQLYFAPPGQDMAVNWLVNQQLGNDNESGIEVGPLLAMANGAPLKALQYADSEQIAQRNELFSLFYQTGMNKISPLSLDGVQLKQGILLPIQWLYSWVSDLIKMQIQPIISIVNSDKSEQLQKLSKRVELSELFQYLDRLVEALQLQRAPLNPQMIMDDLLLQWQQVTGSN